VVKRVNNLLGSTGQQGRTGGEEFIITLPLENLQYGLTIADTIRQEIEDSEFSYECHQLKITISLGVTYCEQGEKFEAIYSRADQALYRAKRNGRNRVEFA
jgi:diguanylate cyclase (GGDEF)-like protein